MKLNCKIEERVGVYLQLNDAGTAWELDLVTLDGYELDGYEGGPNAQCVADGDEDCNCAERMKQARIGLPDAKELFELLGVALEQPGFYDHQARPDDLPEAGDRCNDCGEQVTWIGPSQYDWLHVDDRRNQ